MNSKIDFINGKARSCLFKVFVPLMIAMILNMAYNLVDSIWIGNILGEEAMAALTSATPIILILTSIGMGSTNGLVIILSQAIGAKDDKKVKKILSTSFIISIIFSILVILICELSLNSILSVLNTPNEIYPLAKNYLSIYFFGFLSVFFYLYFTAVLRSYGNTLFQAIGMLACTILNAILDPILINKIGFSGAAIATVFSQSLAVIVMIIYIIKKKLFNVRIAFFDWNVTKDIINKALPSVIQQSIPAISTTALTSIVSGYSVMAIAAFGVTGKLETILFYPAMVFNMSLTTIIGQCFGAKRFDRIKDYLHISLKYGVAMLIILSAIIIGFANQLSYLFLDNYNVSEIVKTYFIIVGIGYVLNTVTNCFLGAVNGLGNPTKGMLIMIFYYIIVRMPLAFILAKTSLELNGVWVAILISHIIAAISATLIFKNISFKMQKVNNKLQAC
ncbi:MAG: MATE family efflux transporter [Clostridiaceae bacterium]|nr:MATE family efflux transporter [Clostridiaceae bacterium]